MPCWTRIEIKLALKWPAKHVTAAVARLEGWKNKGGKWVHQDGTTLNVDGETATLVGANPKAHVRSIATEIVRQQALRYGWKVQSTPQGLRITK